MTSQQRALNLKKNATPHVPTAYVHITTHQRINNSIILTGKEEAKDNKQFSLSLFLRQESSAAKSTRDIACFLFVRISVHTSLQLKS